QLRSATAIIALITVAVSAIAIFSGLDYFVTVAGFIPARISGLLPLAGALPAWITPWSSALIHGSWLHLGLNMLVLLFVGSQVERIIGAPAVVLAYLIGAAVAAATQFAVDPSGNTPVVGASGAISALFGLYALFYGRPKQ